MQFLPVRIYELFINRSWKLISAVFVGYFFISWTLMFLLEAPSVIVTIGGYFQYFFTTAVGYSDHQPVTSAGGILDSVIVGLNRFMGAVFLIKVIGDIYYQLEKRDLGLSQLHVDKAVYVFGYTKEETHEVIEELFPFQDKHGFDIVLCSETEKSNPFHRKNVHFVRGSLSSDDTLARSCVKTARAVAIWGEKDGDTLEIGIAVGKALNDAENFDAHVIPYFEKKRFASSLEKFYEDENRIECVHSLVIKVLAQTIKNPGFFKRIKGFIEGPNNLVVLEVPDDFKERKFADLLCPFKDVYGVLLLGIVDEHSHQVEYNPDKDVIIKPGMSLIYLNNEIAKEIDCKNCRAYAESDSMYRRCPSAKIVSNARDDLPDPESPVKAMILLRGISTLIFLRLCVRAPLTIILSCSFILLFFFGIFLFYLNLLKTT